MATIGSRDFQIGYQKLTEVTRVEARGKHLGTWYPAGTEEMPPEDQVNQIVDFTLEDQGKEIEALQAEVKQLKRQLASKMGPTIPLTEDHAFGASKPAPKPGRSKEK